MWRSDWSQSPPGLLQDRRTCLQKEQQQNYFSHNKKITFKTKDKDFPGLHLITCLLFFFFFKQLHCVITQPAMTSSDVEGPSWLTQSTTGIDPFRMGLFLMPVESVLTCEDWVSMLWSTVWTFSFGSARKTGAGSPIKKNWSFKVVPGKQPFSATLHLAACWTEALLLMAVGSSLLVLLWSGFGLSKRRASFLTVTPWCSETARHTGGSDSKQEFPALNCGKQRKWLNREYHEVSLYIFLDGTQTTNQTWLSYTL